MSDIRCCEQEAQTRSAGVSQAAGCPNGLGSLPDCGSLATPFVPAQNPEAQRYSPNKALEEGGLYPALNLPFHLRVNASDLENTSLNKLRALDFAVHELGLYLDTHPFDQETLSLFRTLTEQRKQAQAEYVRENGPLTMTEAMKNGNYTWWEGPWPWQYAGEED